MSLIQPDSSRDRVANRPPRPTATREYSIRAKRDASRTYRVRLAGKATANAAPGGGETQMMGLSGAFAAMGMDARCWRPWEDDFTQFDWLHLFGSVPEHLPLVQIGRASCRERV